MTSKLELKPSCWTHAPPHASSRLRVARGGSRSSIRSGSSEMGTTGTPCLGDPHRNKAENSEGRSEQGPTRTVDV